jgi:hypothetical protein
MALVLFLKSPSLRNSPGARMLYANLFYNFDAKKRFAKVVYIFNIISSEKMKIKVVSIILS